MSKEINKMFNDKELRIIKDTFADNEDLLKSVRKLLFGAEISLQEKENIKNTFSNPEVLEAVRHKIYGLNNFDTPIGQLSDFWMGAESQMFGAPLPQIKQAIEVKTKVLAMFTKGFELLVNPDGEKVSTEIVIDELGVGIIARNLYMKAIDMGLFTVLNIAGKKGETIEELYKRLEKNSAK
jgi:hypothetical protein